MEDPPIEIEGPAARFRRNLAVVIGIDRYGDGISPLGSAVADARAIAEALRRDHGFETWEVFDEEASRARLLALLSEELGALGPDDRLLVYFAGHGIALDGADGPAGYLVPADARRAEREGFLPMQVVSRELGRLAARHVLVILDCCFAGTFRWSSLRDVEPAAARIYRERYDRYVERPAWQVLTSASYDQLALDVLAADRGEAGSAHSPFAMALLEGLGGAADYTGDQLITASELAMFVSERVAPVAEAMGRRQVPQLFPLDRHDSGEYVFQVPGRALALAAAPPVEESANPYRGLESFREQDRALFFGRSEAAARLVEAVIAQRLTVVVGPSGAGKSSLVHAALVPELRSRSWTVLPTQRPGRDPRAALDAWARSLRPELVPVDPEAAWLTAVGERGDESPWLVVIDQLEELLTYRTAEQDRAAFLEALARALKLSPSLRVVVTVRADSEPQLHDTALGAWWGAARFVVPGLTREQLREIIVAPAVAAVLCFEPPKLVERLLDDVALVPAPLPLLSFALSELYRQCATRWRSGARDRALREADYAEMGSVARALTLRATALHDQLVADDAAYAITIQNVLTRMVAIIGSELARRRVALSELVYGRPDEDRRVAEVLQRFHDARLISLGTEDQGGAPSPYAEPTHDELVRGWARVRRWVDELDTPPGTRALAGAIGGAARSWRAGGEASELLWTDARVELASELGRERPTLFNASEARFVARSARRRRRGRAQLIGGLLAASVVLAVATALALWQRRSAIDSAERAVHNEERAAASESDAQRQLQRLYQETAEKLLIEHRPAEAIPYLVEARRAGASGEPLRVLFYRASHQQFAVPIPGAVRGAAFSPDGARVLAVSQSGTAQIWDASTGKPASPPFARGSRGNAVFSPDGAQVLTGGNAQVWDASTGQSLSPPLVKNGVGAAFSSDGARVLTLHQSRARGLLDLDGPLDDQPTMPEWTARVWDARTWEPRSPSLTFNGLGVFSPDGTRLVITGPGRTARVWDVRTGKPLSPPLEHRERAWSPAFSPDGTRVVTASSDGTARVWDASTGKPLSPPLEHGRDVAPIFSPDGRRLLTAVGDQAEIWDTIAQQAISLPLYRDGVTDMAFSPDGTRVVTASRGGTAQVWDATTGDKVSPPLKHELAVSKVAFSPDGARVVTASERTVRIWDVITGDPVQPPLERGASVASVVVSPDGARVLSVTENGTAQVHTISIMRVGPPLVRLYGVASIAIGPGGAWVITAGTDDLARVWNTDDGKLVEGLHHPGLTSAAFSADAARVVTAGSDGTARVWDAITGQPVSPPLAHWRTVRSAAFSPDGRRVVTASNDETAQLWDAGTGAPVSPPLPHGGPVVCAVFSRDGARIVTATEQETRAWDAATGRPLSPPRKHWGGQVRTLSPDGARVLTMIASTAQVWDTTTGKALSPPLEPPGRMTDAAFSPDGTRVITTGEDKTARIWDATTGRLLDPPLEHRAAVVRAAFSPDGTHVVTADEHGTVRVWATPLDRGTLADWEAIAQRGPYELVDGFLTSR